MENSFKNLNKESILTIKELTKNNQNFSRLINKLNSAKENLDKKHELIIALQR